METEEEVRKVLKDIEKLQSEINELKKTELFLGNQESRIGEELLKYK